MTRLAKIRHWFAAALVCALASASETAATGTGLDSLFHLRDAQSRRASSSDPDWEGGNSDSRMVLPGETLVVADLEGPGIIRHLWFTTRSFEDKYPRLLTLRMYWDNETSPSVECPFGDFFGVVTA